jgi:hypothetical protein
MLLKPSVFVKVHGKHSHSNVNLNLGREKLIKLKLKSTGRQGMGWVHLVQDRDNWGILETRQ